MARKKRNWHPEFLKYMEFIVKHKNYSGMPKPRKEDGSIRWVVSGNSEIGKKRSRWWDERVAKMGLPNRAEVARAIHPKELKGLKPCQICGKKLSIFYVYPNRNTLNKIRKVTNESFGVYQEDIYGIFDILSKKFGDQVFEKLKEIFNVADNIGRGKETFLTYIVQHCRSKLSPGVMSNPPDRFDGFHTYNACCRSKEDTGRHISNLARYGQDRRAYETWAEGNWNFANRLMNEFKRFDEKIKCPGCKKLRKMTADHEGPISLGFTHRPKFRPLCNSCNSGKNNRMTLEDVKTLIEDEKNGEKVISWHSKYLWDELKHKVQNREDALKLSKVMRWHLHNVLSLFSLISSRGYKPFLMRFLHPEYSFVDYKFKDFHPLKPDKLIIIKKELNNKNKKKNAQRYVRISFESLEDYKAKDNRKIQRLENKEIDKAIEELFALLKAGKGKEAYQKLDIIIKKLSAEAIKKFF